MSRAAVNQVVNVFFEVTPGTAGTYTRRLVATRVSFGPKSEAVEFSGEGYKVATLVAQGKEWSEGSVEQQATFEEVQYLLDSAFGAATPGNAVGGTGIAKLRTWTPPSSADTVSPRTFSMEKGDYATSPRRAAVSYALMPDFIMEWDRSSIKFKSRFFGRAIDVSSPTMTALGTNSVQTFTKTGTWSSGNFTLTWSGQTTANIAYNATAAQIEAAMRILSNIQGHNIKVECATVGGTVNTYPMIFTFQNMLGGAAQAAITFNVGTLAGSTPGGGFVQTVTGVAGVSELVVSQMLAKNMDVYVDDTYAALGTTKMTSAFAGQVGVSDRFVPVWAVNSANTSFKDHVEQENKAVSNITLEADSVGEGFFTALRAGTTKFVRLVVTGPLLEGSIYKKLQVDFCAFILNPDDYTDSDKVYALPWNFALAHDKDFGGFIRVALTNALSGN